MKPNIIKNVFLGLVSVLIGLIIAEVSLRLFVPARNIGPSFTTYDPYYGKRLKKNFQARRLSSEFVMKFTTNSLGFRGPEVDFASRPILFLGDSFTMGYGVSDGEEFAALVGKELAIPVINAGIGSNGNGQWIKILREYGVKYNPRAVVLQFMDNDFKENIQERLFALSDSGDLKELEVSKPSKMRLIQNVAESIPGITYLRVVELIRQSFWMLRERSFWNRRFSSNSEPNKFIAKDLSPEQRELTFRLVEEILGFCKDRNWPVVALSTEVKGPPLARLRQTLERYGVKLIEIASKDERSDMYYVRDGHWNEYGHAVAAGLVVEELTKIKGISDSGK